MLLISFSSLPSYSFLVEHFVFVDLLLSIRSIGDQVSGFLIICYKTYPCDYSSQVVFLFYIRILIRQSPFVLEQQSRT